MIMRNMEKNSVTLFKCNQWLSKSHEDKKLVRELAAVVEGEEAIASKKERNIGTITSSRVSAIPPVVELSPHARKMQ